ncbi:hypothetical protein HRbin25_00086 [bacterium HR25]|jgi:hypothetical protein|nr:hypothetical protein HRbin25_00086 [bacterium HR25]
MREDERQMPWVHETPARHNGDNRRERMEALQLAIQATKNIRCDSIHELLVAAEAIMRWLEQPVHHEDE